ncbi:MAG: hypothetical protein IPK00_22485 [Deltaproteobacteria bacterium]|nr:hypothetical protein [Deltaproteobacteria bacterium]
MALLLKKRGIERVRPLNGGFDAWLAAGLPIEPLESEAPAEPIDATLSKSPPAPPGGSG